VKAWIRIFALSTVLLTNRYLPSAVHDVWSYPIPADVLAVSILHSDPNVDSVLISKVCGFGIARRGGAGLHDGVVG